MHSTCKRFGYRGRWTDCTRRSNFQLGQPIAAPPFVRSSVRPPKKKKKKRKLQKFNGDPHRWPLFIQSFKIQVHDALTPDAERLVCLNNLLSAEIQNILGDALLNPGLYPQALNELHRQHGNPQIVAQSSSSTLNAV